MKNYTIVDIFEEKIVFPSKIYTVGDIGVPWLKLNFKYLFGLQTLQGLIAEVKYNLPKGFIVDEYTLDVNNSAEFSINPKVFGISGWVKIFITLKKDSENLITVPGEISLRIRNLNIDNNEVAPVYEVLIQKAIDTINMKIDEAVSVADKKIEEIKTSEGKQGPPGIQGIPGKGGKNINGNQEFETWLGTKTEYDAIIDKSRGILYNWFDDNGNFLGGYYKEALSYIKRGQYLYLDGRDGKNPEDTWKNRLNAQEYARLYNINYDSNGGWTGKGLRLDGVDDYVILNGVGSTLNFKKDFSIQVSVSNFLFNTNKNTTFVCFTGYPVGLELATYQDKFCIKDFSYVNPKFTPYSELKKLTDSKSVFTITHSVSDKTIKIYVDGILKISNTYTEYTSSYSESYDLKLGGLGHSGVAGGIIGIYNSIMLYTECLSPEEVMKNVEYELSINSTESKTYILENEVETYGIGNSNKLPTPHTLRLSNDKTKFVAGLRYCNGLQVDKYTYSEVLEIMETQEWKRLMEGESV